jgi:hypothetical protein
MKLSDLPFEQFEMLGVKKNDLINLPPRTLNALLNGQRTSLIRFNNVRIPGLGESTSLDAKLSIELKQDGKASLKIHPINKTAKNTFNLSSEEIAILEKDNANYIDRNIKLTDGSTKSVMIYLDTMTNEFIAINKTSINAPEEINNLRLTEEQKVEFKSGKAIMINGESFRLNPNSEIGVSSIDGNDLKISKIRFRQSSYSNKELAFDLALLASGFENIVLLEHLANLALYTAPEQLNNQNAINNINNPDYWEAIDNASKEIRTLKEEEKYDVLKITEIVNKHLAQIGVISNTEKKDAKGVCFGNDNKQEKEPLISSLSDTVRRKKRVSKAKV